MLFAVPLTASPTRATRGKTRGHRDGGRACSVRVRCRTVAGCGRVGEDCNMRVHRVSRLRLAVGCVRRGTIRRDMTYKFLPGVA
jgi:hypothetical protein